MRLYLDTHYFISVIQKEEKYSCQVMELIHGMGMYNAEITDNTKDDIISSIVDSKSFKETNKTCSSMQAIFEFHLQCLLDLKNEK